jgi:hypothetical protein
MTFFADLSHGNNGGHIPKWLPSVVILPVLARQPWIFFPVAIPISSGSRNSIRALLTIWANLVKAAIFYFKMAANQIVFCSYPFRNPLRELLIELINLIKAKSN